MPAAVHVFPRFKKKKKCRHPQTKAKHKILISVKQFAKALEIYGFSELTFLPSVVENREIEPK